MEKRKQTNKRLQGVLPEEHRRVTGRKVARYFFEITRRQPPRGIRNEIIKKGLIRGRRIKRDRVKECETLK